MADAINGVSLSEFVVMKAQANICINMALFRLHMHIHGLHKLS